MWKASYRWEITSYRAGGFQTHLRARATSLFPHFLPNLPPQALFQEACIERDPTTNECTKYTSWGYGELPGPGLGLGWQLHEPNE